MRYPALKKLLTKHNLNVTIGNMKPEDLITWRQNHGLTQIALAEKLGVTKACISRWESGRRTVPAFLHLALKCLKVKKGGEHKAKGTKKKREKEVKK